MTRRRRLVRDVARFLVVFLFAAGAVWLVQSENVRRIERAQVEEAWFRYDNTFAACERIQRLRQDDVRHRDAFRQVVAILDVYLESSASFRRRSDNSDLAAAAETARALLRRTVGELDPQASINCDEAVTRPRRPRP